jgi:hypothetical protein
MKQMCNLSGWKWLCVELWWNFKISPYGGSTQITEDFKVTDCKMQKKNITF